MAAVKDAMMEFCDKVSAVCEEQYDIKDGGDLCWNLIEQGVISMADGVDTAARVVAQHIQQA